LCDGVFQSPNDVILPEDIVEGFRTVFPGEDLIAHGAEGRRLYGFVSTGFAGCGGFFVGFVKSRASGLDKCRAWKFRAAVGSISAR
jgi:hypothetical protein